MSAAISRHERFVYPVLAAMVVAAWVAFAASDSLHATHELGAHFGGHADHSAPDHTGSGLRALLFIGSWILMTVAMMMPSTLPLIDIFRRLTRPRSDRVTLVALLIAGYLSAWSCLGIVVYAVIGLARFWVGPTVLTRDAFIAALLFIGAGAFQLAPLKDRCLTECRTPLGFVVRRWDGNRPRLASLRTGLAHGAFCIGCCWALMLLMFAFNVASVAWMLALGLVMGIEKNARWGRRIVKPLGYALLGTGFMLLVLLGRTPG